MSTSNNRPELIRQKTSANVKNAIKSVSAAVVNIGKSEELSWEQLQSIEKRRRSVLKRTDIPFYRVLCYWDGTVIRLLATDPLFWVTVALYILARLQARIGLPDDIIDVKASDIAVLGGFLSFFLVLFLVHNNKRFDIMYGYSMSCEGRIFDVASMARASLPRDAAHRLVRYMNAAHVSGYVGLSETYSAGNFFNELNASFRFLTDQEMERVNTIDLDVGGSVYRELIAWCIMEVEAAKEAGHIDPRHACQFRESVLKLRGALGALYDYADQPVSFFYSHFIMLLSACYLPLFAVSAAFNAGVGDEAYWTSDVIAGLVVVLQVVFVIGLRLLAQKWENPYGSDLEDLSVMHYIRFTATMSQRILAAEKPAPLDPIAEEELMEEREPIGKAWGHPEKEKMKDNDFESDDKDQVDFLEDTGRVSPSESEDIEI